MSEYDVVVYVCAMFWILFVFSHVTATRTAMRMCEKTCRLLDMQTKAMEKEMESREY